MAFLKVERELNKRMKFTWRFASEDDVSSTVYSVSPLMSIFGFQGSFKVTVSRHLAWATAWRQWHLEKRVIGTSRDRSVLSRYLENDRLPLNLTESEELDVGLEEEGSQILQVLLIFAPTSETDCWVRKNAVWIVKT